MFRKLALSLAAAAGLIVPARPSRLRRRSASARFASAISLAESSPVENAQFVWGGRNYCWYDSAWRGPGWYRCGFAWRRGLGWGGAAGWHGWHRPVHRPVHHQPYVHAHRTAHAHDPPVNRPPHNRPNHNRPSHNRPPAHRPAGPRGGRIAAAASAQLSRPEGRFQLAPDVAPPTAPRRGGERAASLRCAPPVAL